MTTELRLNAQVVSADGLAGQLTDVILDPASDQVTHLVVEVKGFGHPQHLVPVVLVQASSAREVRLKCSSAELRRTEFFTETEPVQMMDASTALMMADDALAWRGFTRCGNAARRGYGTWHRVAHLGRVPRRNSLEGPKSVPWLFLRAVARRLPLLEQPHVP